MSPSFFTRAGGLAALLLTSSALADPPGYGTSLQATISSGSGSQSSGTCTGTFNNPSCTTAQVGNGSATNPSLAVGSATDGLYNTGSHVLGFTTNGTNAGVIDASQRWVIGATGVLGSGPNAQLLQVLGAGAAVGTVIYRFSADASSGNSILGKSRGATVGTHGAIVSSDALGTITFEGDDGTNYNTAGVKIQALINGTVSTGHTPTDLSIQTSSVTTTANAFVAGHDQSIQLPGLAPSSASQTGTVCWTTATGNLTVDTTTTCLLSDENAKQDVVKLSGESALAEVIRWEPVAYRYKPAFRGAGCSNGSPLNGGTVCRGEDRNLAAEQVGFTAQRMAKVDPRLVSYGPDGQPHSVRYQQSAAVLAAAVQELNGIVQSQQVELKALARRLEARH